jgi:hypothetical protein
MPKCSLWPAACFYRIGGDMGERPPDLASLKLPDWYRQHPVKSYTLDSDGPHYGQAVYEGVKAARRIITVGVRGSLGPLGWLSLGFDLLKAWCQPSVDEIAAERKEAQREDFRNLMWEKFWTNEAFYDSNGVREAAFDKFAGDNTGHNTVPPLTQQAEIKKSEMIDRIDDRWLEKLERASELQQRLEEVEKSKPAPDAPPFPKFASPGEYVSAQQAWAWQVEGARKELDSYYAEMGQEALRDMQSVKDFESKPANWDLTPDQQNILTDKMEPEASDERSDDDRFYDVVGGRPH